MIFGANHVALSALLTDGGHVAGALSENTHALLADCRVSSWVLEGPPAVMVLLTLNGHEVYRGPIPLPPLGGSKEGYMDAVRHFVGHTLLGAAVIEFERQLDEAWDVATAPAPMLQC